MINPLAAPITPDRPQQAATTEPSHRNEAQMTLTEPPAPQALTDERFTAIEERAAKATPGPWRREDDHKSLNRYVFSDDDTLDINFGYVGNRTQADAEFVAHAREDVDVLLAEVKRLRGTVALACVLEVPRPDHRLSIQLRRSHGHADRWAISDGMYGQRWHRELGWVYEAQGIRDEAERDATRYTLAEALPLAQRIAAGEVQS